MAFLLILALIAVSAAIGQPRGTASHEKTGGGGFDKFAAQLGLTPDQEATLKGLRQEFRTETAGIRESLRTKWQELSALFRDPKAKDEDIIAKRRELSALRDQIGQKAVEYLLKARKVLTPEQLAKLPEWGQLGIGPGHWKGRGMGKGGQEEVSQ
jgi:Spy/CpxP family protein refolding chaperone